MFSTKTRSRIARALLTSLLPVLAACGQADAGPRELTATEWRRDLAWLAEKLPARHGGAFNQVSQADFEAAVARLDERIPRLERHEVLVELGRIVALVGDGHTELWLPQQATGFRRLPIAVGYFADELWIFAATADHAELIGRRVLAIGDVPTGEAYERVIPLIGRDNDYEYLRSAPIYLMFPEILNAVGITPSPEEAVLTLAEPAEEALGRAAPDGQAPDGAAARRQTTVTLRPVDAAGSEWITAWEAADSPPPLYLTRPDRWYWYDYLEPSRTLYLQYDRCRDQPGEPSIKKFARELFDFVDAHPVDRFVLDLRHNTGGNFHRNRPLVEGIRSRPEINRRGRLFVITSRTTFSAATMAAIDLARQTEAILVGEPSRGRPNGYSDEKHLRLPNSNVEVNYSPLYRAAMPELGDAPFLPVDLPVEPRFEEYSAGHDPVLEAILEYRGGLASGSPVTTARRDG